MKEDQYAVSGNLEARIAIHRYSVKCSNIWEWVWDRYRFGKGDRILEVGSGTGQFWKEQYHKLPNDCSLTLVDFSAAMLAKSRETLYNFPINFRQADVENLPFQTGIFDMILCHFMLYHATSQEQALDEITRVLKPDGWASFITNSQSNMKRVWDLAREIDSGFRYENHMTDSFCEENAESILNKCFSKINKQFLDDVLQVDNSTILIDYIKSILGSTELNPSEDFYREFSVHIDNEIRSKGHFTIPKRSALYLCSQF